jgi:phage terminase Nu1 subunit (DNA packaging protein)
MVQIYNSATELAKLLRLSSRRVSQLVKEGVIKKEANGTFDTPQALEDYFAFKFKDDNAVDYEKEHALLEAAKREKAEIELELLKGSLLYATDVEQVMATMILTCKSRLLSIPTKCATQVIGLKDLSTIVEIIRDAICEALNELKEIPAPEVIEDDAIDT